jgi:hypothetical protein
MKRTTIFALLILPGLTAAAWLDTCTKVTINEGHTLSATCVDSGKDYATTMDLYGCLSLPANWTGILDGRDEQSRPACDDWDE